MYPTLIADATPAEALIWAAPFAFRLAYAHKLLMRRIPAGTALARWRRAALAALQLTFFAAFLFAAVQSVAAQSVAAQSAAEIAGRPRVVDGDTLDFAGRRVRLYGVDAPELEQTCRAGGRVWPCGLEARWAALNRLSPHWVTCVPQGWDVVGTERARCYLAGVGQHDLGAWLLRRGWALAEPGADPAYVEAQAAAEAAELGLWRGSFVAPWAWRLGQRLPEATDDATCSGCDARHQRLKRNDAGRE